MIAGPEDTMRCLRCRTRPENVETRGETLLLFLKEAQSRLSRGEG